MSVTVTTDIVCDRCGVWETGVTGRTKAAINDARAKVKEGGWTTKKVDSKHIDLCPGCSNEGEKIDG